MTDDFFINDYVVENKKGHPGSNTYTVIATRQDMTKLVEALSEALDKSEDSPDLLHFPEGLTLLWNEYASVAGGQTSRVYLRFALAKDLARYHMRPPWSDTVIANLGCPIVIITLGLALVGLRTVLQSLFP